MSIAKWCFSGAVVLLAGASFASAQTSFDLNLGFGSAWDSAAPGGIENFNSLNAFGACTPAPGDPTCLSLPRMGGFFMGFGGDLMLNKRFGGLVNFTVQPGLQNYGPLQYRQLFYDFDGIYAPINTKRAQLRLQGGIGGSHTGFSINQNQCVGVAVCSNFTQPFGASSHFAVNVGVGFQYYITNSVFIRPEFDYHYVPGLTNQFGSNNVPEAMIYIGYSFGDRGF